MVGVKIKAWWLWWFAWWFETVCCMDRTTGGQTAPDEDQVTMVAMQGVLSGDIHVADECVHSLHGSLCHLWVCHWPQDVHKEQLGGSGTHPACAQAEMTWCPHVDVTCTCSLTSHACCNCPAAAAARLHCKLTSTKASHAAILSCALLIVGTCTESQHLVCQCCLPLTAHMSILFRHHTTLSMKSYMLCSSCLSVLSAAQ